MPFGTYRSAIRVGGAAVDANAGVMASRTGSAMAAPIPCNIARLESRLPGFMRCSFHSVSHLERRALDDRGNQARKFVVCGRRLPADLVDHRGIGSLQTPSQRKGQHLLRKVSCEQAGLRLQ